MEASVQHGNVASKGGPLWSRIGHALRGPRLQVLNLAVFYTAINIGSLAKLLGVDPLSITWPWVSDLARIDYPNPLARVGFSVALATIMDAALTRAKTGRWSIPWGTVVATMGIWLMLNGRFAWSFVLLPVLLVGSKHLIRTKSGHLLNANNAAACVLILLGWATIGVNDWGTEILPVALMFLFGTIATLRAKRFLVAVTYLLSSGVVYLIICAVAGYDRGTWLGWAYPPVAVMVAFFAVTDPATSPKDHASQVVYTFVAVLLAVPATLALHPDAVVFALFAAALQRHAITALVERVRVRLGRTANAGAKLEGGQEANAASDSPRAASAQVDHAEADGTTPTRHATSAPTPGTHATNAPTPGTHRTSAPTPGTHTTSAPTLGTHATTAGAPGTHATTTATPNTHAPGTRPTAPPTQGGEP